MEVSRRRHPKLYNQLLTAPSQNYSKFSSNHQQREWIGRVTSGFHMTSSWLRVNLH
jgi:hypothetical protein